MFGHRLFRKVIACFLGLWIGVIGWAGMANAEELEVWPPVPSQDDPKIQNMLEGFIEEVHSVRSPQTPWIENQLLNSLFVFRANADRIQVVIEAISPASVTKLTQAILNAGGRVESVYQTLIQAMVPASKIRELAQLKEARFIRLPVQPDQATEGKESSTTQGSITSEGLTLIGAPAWHNAGIKGEGRKVAVLDSQFGNYPRLLGTELPPQDRVTARSFRSDGRFFPSGDESRLVHGTAVAEIIHDIAPEAAHYLAAFGTDVEYRQAIEWAIAQKVDVISSSIVFRSGCLRGGGQMEPLLAKARESGILWSNSGGNDGNSHWSGAFEDKNENSQHEWAPSDEEIVIETELVEGEIRGEKLPVVSMAFVYAWDGPCENAGNDYEVQIFRPESSRPLGGDWLYRPGFPVKFTSWIMGFRDAQVGDRKRFRIVLQRVFGATAPRFDIVMTNCSRCLSWEHNNPEGSVSFREPGNSTNVMSVAAAHHDPSRCGTDCSRTVGLLNYSSRGPTYDGRIKPDMAAPTHVSTSSYGSFSSRNRGFTGTSAAQPHAAGAALLAKQAFPDFTPPQLQEFLEKRTEDRGAPGKDNDWGAGFLLLGRPAGAQADLKLSVTNLTFSAQQNGANPPAQAVQITNVGSGTLTWTASSNQPWLALDPTSGTAPSTLNVSVNITGLPPGSYTGQVTVTAQGAANSPAIIQVSLTVQAPPQPAKLTVSPSSLSFSGTRGGTNPASQAVQISNTGGGTLNWVTVADKPWISLSATNGSAPPATTVNVTVNLSGLAAGAYEGQVIVTSAEASNSPQIVAVRLQVTEQATAVTLLAPKFTQLVFVTNGWVRELRSGCVAYKNNTDAVGKVQLALAGSSAQEHTVLAGRDVLICADIAYVESVGEPRTIESLNTEGRPVVLKFNRIEMGEPTRWERSIREGCLVFKNIRTEANAFKVTLSDGSARELSVAAGKEIILCGDLVHVE
jgi:hypothetical protein